MNIINLEGPPPGSDPAVVMLCRSVSVPLFNVTRVHVSGLMAVGGQC
jgi:hypothetical protein